MLAQTGRLRYPGIGWPAARLTSASCGHLGWAFSAGIGAKCAVPGRPVIAFTGDAGLYYHLARLATDMGALRIRVDKPGDLRPSLERALAAVRPAVIDVRTDIDVTAPLAVS